MGRFVGVKSFEKPKPKMIAGSGRRQIDYLTPHLPFLLTKNCRTWTKATMINVIVSARLAPDSSQENGFVVNGYNGRARWRAGRAD